MLCTYDRPLLVLPLRVCAHTYKLCLQEEEKESIMLPSFLTSVFLCIWEHFRFTNHGAKQNGRVLYLLFNNYNFVNRLHFPSSYPPLIVVPSALSDDSIRRLAKCHRQLRFPAITWRHPRTKALLLRSSGFHGKSVMGMIKSSTSQTSNPRESKWFGVYLVLQGCLILYPAPT